MTNGKRELGQPTSVKLFEDQERLLARAMLALAAENSASVRVDKSVLIRTAVDELFRRLGVVQLGV